METTHLRSTRRIGNGPRACRIACTPHPGFLQDFGPVNFGGGVIAREGHHTGGGHSVPVMQFSLTADDVHPTQLVPQTHTHQ